MDINKEPIIVKYRKKQNECKCCGRPFTESEFGELREFEVTMKKFFEWTNWSKEDLKDVYLEDLDQMVSEWLYDTINFYACDMEDVLLIDKSEGKRIVQIVKSEVGRLKGIYSA
ncbi:hypothetical protein [Lysinibacillus odysseyi]|uniref:Uncharacterized protein n=1 Tax=Lysinibacillus odysseyi 34hs-1 = NBRC 100172 TaxID=1220589 RepID=A0A0A3JN24_9BACI|nr:hypothetical protein [Lysinibacillus odysseyi]KGR88417.1 hypothetical protein CD32_01785 [Lysinibacillus odysseyi 34hs-1 = NBRC 100172]